MEEKKKSIKSGDAKVLMEAFEERAFCRLSAKEEVNRWVERKAEEEPIPQEIAEERDRKVQRKGTVMLVCLGVIVIGLIVFFMKYA